MAFLVGWSLVEWGFGVGVDAWCVGYAMQCKSRKDFGCTGIIDVVSVY